MPPDDSIFICHASEDKEPFVRELANALIDKGLRVWYDDFSLTLGDSLRSKIDQGLANCRYGIVILSEAFFKKEWTQKELNGLVAKETGSNKVILPIWHGVTKERVLHFSPILADRKAVSSDKGMDRVVEEIMRVVKPEIIEEQKGTSNTSKAREVTSTHSSQPRDQFPIKSIELRTFQWGMDGNKIGKWDEINGALVTVVSPDEIEVVSKTLVRFGVGFLEYCAEEVLGLTRYIHNYLKFHFDYDEKRGRKTDEIIEKLMPIISFRTITFTLSNEIKFSHLIDICNKKGLTRTYDSYTKTLKLKAPNIPREFQGALEIRIRKMENECRVDFDLQTFLFKETESKWYKRINPHTIMNFFKLS